jgi:hypothetical protein
MGDQEMKVDNAHSYAITDIAYAKVGGVATFFTSSLDMSISCWQVQNGAIAKVFS